MKIVTWNVNGIRAVLQKDKSGKRETKNINVINELIKEHDPDIICLQETKCPADLELQLPFAYKKIIASQTKKGYSGVAVFSKINPIKELDDFPHNEEGRVIVLEYVGFYLINTYTPNSKPDLSRLDYRINIWEKEIRTYINRLQKKKPIVYVSDFNVAPTEIDIHDPKGNMKTHGFTIQERGAFSSLLNECDLVDAYRKLHPDDRKYTWFSNFAKSRERNKGWRIDMVLVSKQMSAKIESVEILSDYYGSDHIPVIAKIKSS
jgi:exodeoxyribonuclease-3